MTVVLPAIADSSKQSQCNTMRKKQHRNEYGKHVPDVVVCAHPT